jgi:histidinol-phosphate aminotransferase
MDINNLVRENIKKLKPYSSARGKFTSGILLDANENPFNDKFEIQSLELNRYPDPNQIEIRNAIGKYLGLNYENIFVGVGSDEIIDLLIRVFCKPRKDEALIFEPTYGMYKVACEINDIKINSILLNDDFQIDLDAINSEVLNRTKIIFICSPNNPTGNLLNSDTVLSICENSNAIVVLDEAYIDFCEDESLIKKISAIPNLVVTRTFSKAWGMAGVRCGYCAADKKIINWLFKIKAPYNINKLTEQTIINSIKNSVKKEEYVKRILSEKEYLIDELKNVKEVKIIYPTDSNFILFKINNATSIKNNLAENGIIIRDRSNQPLLDDCLRVSVGTRYENELFIEELKRMV